MRSNVPTALKNGVETAFVSLLNAAQLPNPYYEPIEVLERSVTGEAREPSVELGSSEVEFLGKATLIVGGGVIATGLLMEQIGIENLDAYTVLTGIGGIAIGGAVLVYEKLTDR